jgi:HAD superfamily phosphoserine phosphatase-like hydrolase
VAIPFLFLQLIIQRKWSNEAGKKALLHFFFGDYHRSRLEQTGEAFCRQMLPGILRRDLLEKLRAARAQGDKIAIVSASADVWLRPFCEAEGFELLCTELAYEQDVFRGYFATPNCNGVEKARRITAAFRLHDFMRIIAYGNSRGDEAMFALADEVIRF